MDIDMQIDTPRKSFHGSSFRDYSGLVNTLPNLKYSTSQSRISNDEAHFHNIKMKHVVSLVRSKEVSPILWFDYKVDCYPFDIC